MLDSNQKMAIDKFKANKITRRSFLVSAGVIAGGISLGSILTYIYRKYGIEPPYSKKQTNIISSLHDHLFPKTDDSPGAADINSAKYLEFVLIDPNTDEDDGKLLKNGVVWLEEESQGSYKKSFIDLNYNEKDTLLFSIEDQNWGYRFISLNLTYIFEALLADPIYGGNPNEIGWKWLNHTPGVPRPTNSTKYKIK